MKSYNHLWEKFISDENIEKAINKAKKGKTRRKNVRKYLENMKFRAEIKAYAITFKNAKHTPVEIYDGIQRKKRKIIVPNFREQVIHHMVVNVLQPIFMHGMYEYSCGSIPNRGGHYGMMAVKRWITKGNKHCKYCLKMDIRKYFDSIPHSIYLAKFRKLIHDELFMRVIEEITKVMPNGVGLPLGFYTSQWTANWYLQDLDHYIKERLHAKYYIRYMDDMVIFGANKRELHRIRKDISVYLNNILGLEMKGNWKLFLFHFIKANGKEVGSFLDFMGFRFYRNRITLRRTIIRKMRRKAFKIGKHEKPTIYEMKQMMSYLGWISCTDVYDYYLKWIKPNVNIQYMKRRISRYDKCEAKKRRKLNENNLVSIIKYRKTA